MLAVNVAQRSFGFLEKLSKLFLFFNYIIFQRGLENGANRQGYKRNVQMA